MATTTKKKVVAGKPGLKAKVSGTTKTTPGTTKASGKTLTPLEKARLARAAGKKGGKAAPKKGNRPAQVTWQAPADFKPFFLEVAVKTEPDGLLGNAIKAVRYVGRYDPQAEDKKKFDLGAYDTPTLIGIQSRIAGKTFKTNPTRLMPSGVKERNVTEKVTNKNTGETRDKLTYGSGYRLPANTAFYILLRIGRRTADNVLTVGLKHIQQTVKLEKNGVKKVVKRDLDKKDPAYRLIMGAKRFLPAAFKDVLLPPKRTRGANKKKDEDGDE